MVRLTQAQMRHQNRKQYDNIVSLHGEQCWVCHRGRKADGRKLHIDHDHKTGQIRGLLCHRCNRGIAWFSDNPERLRRAADYLDRPDELYSYE